MATTSLLRQQRRLLILGGNGYVGQNICHAAIQSQKFDVVRSLNRSGAPSLSLSSSSSLWSSSHYHDQLVLLFSSLEKVEFISGDIFDDTLRDEVVSFHDIIISCIGAFGSNDFMERICGDATILAIRSAAAAAARGGDSSSSSVEKKKFGFISSAQVYDGSWALTSLPSTAPMYGYFHGKYRAEEELRAVFPNTHVILRPGFIYGPRRVRIGRKGNEKGEGTNSTIVLPLQWIGQPLDFVGTRLGPISKLLQTIPFVGKEVSSMVHVQSVANAMIASLLDDDEDGEDGETTKNKGVILEAEQIRRF